jgi:hydroxymethylglutaryl-CoA reductase (NADPH)
MVTLSFAAGSRDLFVEALNHYATLSTDELGVKYQIEARDTETIGEMKGGKWMAYAARALIVRFWELAKVSSSRLLCVA